MDSLKTFGVKVNIYFMRIIHDELKILVIQKKGKDYWEFPNAIFSHAVFEFWCVLEWGHSSFAFLYYLFLAFIYLMFCF